MKTIEQFYLQSAGAAHQKKYAQFFTPPEVADFMRNWILTGQKTDQIFDPAFGLGAFYRGCSEKISFSGMDSDLEILNFFTAHFPDAKVSLSHENYLSSFKTKFQNIICNPPYLKFQNFENKDQILKEIESRCHIKLSGYTNTASVFLVKSICELEDGGRMAYIMPSEFLNTNYGIAIKKLLVKKKFLRAIVKIECEKEVFPDATTSLCILLYDSGTPTENLAFYSINSLEKLSGILTEKPTSSIPYSKLDPESKWDIYFNPRSPKPVCESRNIVKLSTYGHFSRGIATGANEFFVLRKSKIISLGLTDSDYIPCISKSQQISASVFSCQSFDALSESDAPVYLFNAKNPVSKPAGAYIDYGEKNGFDQRFLTRNRSPWYKMEHRESAPILLNVFSRQGYKVIRNTSNAVTLTSFHCFFPNIFGYKYVDSLFLFLLSDAGRQLLSFSMRKYGNNLDKFEPNDLNNSMVPSENFFDSIPVLKIKELLAKLKRNENIKKDLDIMFLPLIN